MGNVQSIVQLNWFDLIYEKLYEVKTYDNENINNDVDDDVDDDLFIDGLVLSVLMCLQHENRTKIFNYLINEWNDQIKE